MRFLPISKDEKVKMVKKDASWSTVEKDGQQGLVPTSYIRLMTETALGSSALLPNNIKKPFQLIQEKSDIQFGQSTQSETSAQSGQSAQSLSSIQQEQSIQSELPMQQGLQIQKYKYEDFEIIRALTSGAFGRVYVVKHKITSKLYILKRVPYLSNQEKKIANEEVNQLRLAQNKYTVILYDVFQFDVDICILQEFCSNGNMRDLIGLMKSWTVTKRKNKCTIYLYQMLSGLRAIHSKKILHRDIKPENILIDKYGNIKIADFGLALKLASQSYIHAAGTKNYSPSEAIISDRMTELSDVWAVGVVIIELITGINPFEGITQEETIMNIKVGRMKPLPDYIQGELKDLLLGMVNVDAEKRPTVDQLLNSELMQLMDENEQMKEVENSQKINEIIKLQQESEQK
ncbi:MAG: putative aurora kinase, partial [Streblomastix strix]